MIKNAILYSFGAVIVGSEKVVNSVKKVKNIKKDAKAFYSKFNNDAVEQYKLKDTVKKQKEELERLKSQYTDMLTHNQIIDAEVE